ncbi:MAG: hypothetical protein GY820_41170 [Gammaproteobacteria bacterium]|nr:hypothetical protein [Gammaproteobacteria bacterium]
MCKKWKRDDITPDVLRRLLRLDEGTGKLYWRERGPEWFQDGYFTKYTLSKRWNSRNKNNETFTKINSNGGGLVGQVLGIKFCKTRVCFAIINGVMPKSKIMNGDDVSQSIINHKAMSDRDRPFYKGVSKSRNGSKLGYRSVFLGSETYHKTPIEAARAYDKAAFGKWGCNARLNFPEQYGLEPNEPEIPEGYLDL